MRTKGKKYLALITILALTISLFTGYSFAAVVNKDEAVLPVASIDSSLQPELTVPVGTEKLVSEIQTYEINYLLRENAGVFQEIDPVLGTADIGTMLPIRHPQIDAYQVMNDQPLELVISDDASLNQVDVFYEPVVIDPEEPASIQENNVIGQNDEIGMEEAGNLTSAQDFYYPGATKGPQMRNVSNANMIWPNPGALQLSKGSDPIEGSANQWEISLTIEGKNIHTTSDVVLVIDKSGSMEGSKMANTRAAAKAFVDQLLLNSGTNRIAVVSFDENPEVVAEFTDYTGKDELKLYIDGINAHGATNMQGGIRQAQILLNSSTADNRVMVILGDGKPTRSYKVTGVNGITLTHGSLMVPIISYDKPVITEVDYSKLVGDSSNYSLMGWPPYRYWIPCNIHPLGHVTDFPADNGVAAIYEAGFADAAGIDIYSIAMEAGSNGEYVLNTIQNSGYYELNNSDLNVLTDVFSEIAGKIAYAASDGIVIDPMGEMFDLIESGITASQGTITIEPANQINWKVGNIAEGTVATLSYSVQIKEGADANTNYPTNLTTSLNYIDVYGDPAVKYFPIPEVAIGGGSILVKGYLVNGSGQPINQSGIVVERPDLAERLYDSSYSSDPLTFNKTYDVTQQGNLAPGYLYVNYVWDQDTGVEESVSVLLQSPAPVQTIWFGYRAIQAYTVTYTIIGDYFTNAEYAAESYEHGTKVTALAVPNKSGYNFHGWTGVPVIMPAKDVIVTGYYTKKGTGGDRPSGGRNTSYESIEVPEEPTATPLNKDEHFAYIVGYPDNTVQPEGAITREEIAAVFYRLLDAEYRDTVKTTINDFPDVDTDRWSAKHVSTLASIGIIVGYPDGSFRPENTITRAELATIASKFDKLSPFEDNSFSDIEGHWANQYINSAAEKGWVTGYSDGTFKPDQAITRAEFMTLVNKVLARKVQKKDILPDAKDFPDLSPNAWYYTEVQEAINSHHYERATRQDYEIWTDIYYPELDM